MRCSACLYGIRHPSGDFHCHHPTVNRERPAWLAGRATAAQTCHAERQNVVGRCGRQGRLFVPRVTPPDA